jgi:hypothetical protein
MSEDPHSPAGVRASAPSGANKTFLQDLGKREASLVVPTGSFDSLILLFIVFVPLFRIDSCA